MMATMASVMLDTKASFTRGSPSAPLPLGLLLDTFLPATSRARIAE